MFADIMHRKAFTLERRAIGHHEFKPGDLIEDSVKGLVMAGKLAGSGMWTREAARRGLLPESGRCSPDAARGEIVFRRFRPDSGAKATCSIAHSSPDPNVPASTRQLD